MASNVLRKGLERLWQEGLLERRAYEERPPPHEYALTVKGRAVVPAMIMLMKGEIATTPAPAASRG